MRAVIKGKRVTLSKLRMSDVDAITMYCKDYAVARWTQNIPHPYKRKDAVEFIRDSVKRWKKKEFYLYAIKLDKNLVGAIDIRIGKDDTAEIGYWVGKPHWGKGYATEATRLIIREGFKKLKLNKIYATYNPKNPASGRVMQKSGMKYEGTLRQHIKARGKYWDTAYCGILRKEFRR